MASGDYTKKARGLSLLSGGLDSQLAVCVLRDAGAEMEGVTFATPFFTPDAARKAAAALGIKLHVVDFTDDVAAAQKVGTVIAQRAAEKGIKQVVFDRGGYIYQGKIAALAQAAREAGLEF